MSVYTELTAHDIEHILSSYELGALRRFEGIAAGIENSNFFVDTEQGRFVLTVFERLDASELPYFMRLMRHLAQQGVACPDVMVRGDGSLIFDLDDAGTQKYGCMVSCLAGKTLDVLNQAQLRAAGEALAGLHLAGQSFAEQRENPTGTAWLGETIAQVLPRCAEVYGQAAVDVLRDEWQQQQAWQFEDLPSGVIHGDLFVDNILFSGDEVSGVIDFYYAHTAPWLMDVAIALNAQAMVLGEHDATRMQVWLDGYQHIRPLTAQEQACLPKLLRLAALRFWVSRLYDALFPREGAMTQVKDPIEYEQKLLQHRQGSSSATG